MDLNNEINTRTLKRFDPLVENILSSATQVAVYNYSSTDWVKIDVEGALFVVSKKGSNNYGLFIMNRLSTNNFNETIDKRWEVTLNLPFIMYKNDKDEIRCVWFYDQIDCKKVYEKLRELTTQLNTGFSKPHVGETLAKLGIKQPQQQMITNDTDQFMRSLIQQTTQKLSLNNDLSDNQSPNIFNDKPLPNLPATPGTLTRSLNLQELFNTTSAPKPSVITNLSNTFMEKIVADKTPIKSKVDISNDVSELVLTPAMLKQNGNSKSNDGQLSPPMLSSQHADQLYRPTPTQLNSNSLNEFISPFQTKSTNASTNLINQQAPNKLTMEQLKQTLIHLLQNDADFLHAIHTAYSKNLQNNYY